MHFYLSNNPFASSQTVPGSGQMFNMKKAICLLILCNLLWYESLAQVKTKSPKSIRSKKAPQTQYGTASFYHNKFNGRKTASGKIFNQKKLTAAHNTVPLGTWLKVTNMRNKKAVIVQVIDRLDYRSRRLVDLSKAAANKIGFTKTGLLPVKVEITGKSKSIAIR